MHLSCNNDLKHIKYDEEGGGKEALTANSILAR